MGPFFMAFAPIFSQRPVLGYVGVRMGESPIRDVSVMTRSRLWVIIVVHWAVGVAWIYSNGVVPSRLPGVTAMMILVSGAVAAES